MVMGRYTITCPECKKSKTASTRHGFKLFALTHGVTCSAQKFRTTEQLTLGDLTGVEGKVESGGSE